jgi:glutaredoxin 3
MRKLAFYFLFFLFFYQSNLVAQTSIGKEEPKEKTTKVIFVYGSADCHFCIATKQKLIESKLNFVFYDIDTDKAALTEMLNKLRNANISTNNLGIPVIDKYGEIFTNNTDFQQFLLKVTK